MEKKRILVVEDNRIIALDLKIMLEKNGYNVIGTINNGEEVLERIGELNPDAILMDINLGSGIDGIVVAEKLENKYPVIYVTSFGDKETRERMVKTNPSAYVQKPFSEKLLIGFLERALLAHQA